MENGQIDDEQITASSSFDLLSTGPQNSRIRTSIGGGAWCPQHQINATSAEWLQIVFPQDMLLTAVETQGRDDNGLGAEFAQSYRIEYWRPSLDAWARYKDGLGKEIIDGNTDPRSSIHRELDGAIVARRIRFVPVSQRTRTVCMRVEVYGCQYRGDLVSYSIPEGTIADGLSLKDFHYDGKISPSNHLLGGIGKLYDGKVGENDFEKKPNGWIAWKNEGKPIEMNFTFVEQMNFSAILFHTSNHFKMGAETFSEASIRFSQNGNHFSSRKVHFTYHADRQFDTARWIRIPIQSRIAKFLQIQLQPSPSSQWLLLSEVEFDLEPVTFEWEDTSAPYEHVEHNGNTVTLYAVDGHDQSTLFGFLASLSALLGSFCLVAGCLLRVSFRRRRPPVKPIPSPAFSQKHPQIHLMMDGSTIKRVSPSTYQMTKDNMHNAFLEKIPIDGEYADPDFSVSTECGSRMPLLAAYQDANYSKSLMLTSRSRALSSPLSCVTQYADYGEIYYHQSPQIDPAQLQFVRNLEGCQMRNVKLCQLERRLVVVKSLEETEETRRELQFLGSLKHPNVLEMIGTSTGQPFFCVLEYAENGSLQSYFQKMERLDTKTALSAVVGVVAGLSFLESRQIILSHLATHTCFVDRDGNVKVARIGG
ncbi:unnamed protein product, partial [Mesorhabditis belari]|uniref:Protein kinase domain-containing protein n=1 Tax=Mesorhabditis belari TaxID=2138241 RepID=A0AAF3J699_9BILA